MNFEETRAWQNEVLDAVMAYGLSAFNHGCAVYIGGHVDAARAARTQAFERVTELMFKHELTTTEPK